MFQDPHQLPRKESDLEGHHWIVLTAHHGWFVSPLRTKEATRRWHEANGHEVIAIITNPLSGGDEE